MEFLAEVQIAEGPLAVERQRLLDAALAMVQVAVADPSGASREGMADTTTALAANAEKATLIAARFTAEAERNTCSLTKGAYSMPALLNTECGMSRKRANLLKLIGSAGDRYPHFADALMDGLISAGHIEVVHRVWKLANRSQFMAAERRLAGLAAMCTPEEFADYLAEWRNHADEEAALDEFLAQQARQHLVTGFDLFGNSTSPAPWARWMPSRSWRRSKPTPLTTPLPQRWTHSWIWF